MLGRTFAASEAAAWAAPAADRLAPGVIGSGGRGAFVMSVLQKDSGVRVGADCGVYEPDPELALSVAAGCQGGVLARETNGADGIGLSGGARRADSEPPLRQGRRIRWNAARKDVET